MKVGLVSGVLTELSLSAEIERLSAFGCARIIHIAGTDRTSTWQTTLGHLQSGDELVVANLAALADDIVALGGIARSLRALGVKLVCLDDRGKQKACAEGEGLGLLDAVAAMEE